MTYARIRFREELDKEVLMIPVRTVSFQAQKRGFGIPSRHPEDIDLTRGSGEF